MFKQKAAMAAIVTALICVLYPQFVFAESFTGTEFLNWPKSNQTSYLHISIAMAGLIARRNKAPQGDCIDRWYFKDQDNAYTQIIKTMMQYPDYHPRGVILAMIEKKCGKLVYTQN